MSEEHAVFIDEVIDGSCTILVTAPELEPYGVYVPGSMLDWEDRVGSLVVLRRTDEFCGGIFYYWKEAE